MTDVTQERTNTEVKNEQGTLKELRLVANQNSQGFRVGVRMRVGGRVIEAVSVCRIMPYVCTCHT